ncbi:MAG: hypothetical protein KDE48_18305 [Anaerolineales bacterium]|nr:hypothetical protein [Anaerolineales bacterium]
MDEITEETAVMPTGVNSTFLDEISAQPAAIPGRNDNISTAEPSAANRSMLPETTDVALNPDLETSLTTEQFDALRSLTSLLVGGVIEGSDILLARLKKYEAKIRAEGLDNPQALQPETAEDRVRYAAVGFLFDQQAWLRRNLKTVVVLLDNAIEVAERASQPVVQSRIAAPITNPLMHRYEKLVEKGQSNLARWTQIGRANEPVSRELARRTYQEIIDEFIEDLADNEELQDLVAQQSLGLASEVRDEIRERTVTGDNVLEGIVRRIMRRTPRAELPIPPPEVQKWAQYTFEDRRERE